MCKESAWPLQPHYLVMKLLVCKATSLDLVLSAWHEAYPRIEFMRFMAGSSRALRQYVLGGF